MNPFFSLTVLIFLVLIYLFRALYHYLGQCNYLSVYLNRSSGLKYLTKMVWQLIVDRLNELKKVSYFYGMCRSELFMQLYYDSQTHQHILLVLITLITGSQVANKFSTVFFQMIYNKTSKLFLNENKALEFFLPNYILMYTPLNKAFITYLVA